MSLLSEWSMKVKFLLLILLSTLISCRTFDMILHPNDYTKRDDNPTVKEIIYDTVKVINDNGNILTAVTGLPTKRIIFTKIGQSFSFKNGETVEIVLDGIDFAKVTFDIETDLETQDVTLKLVDRDFSKVVLTSKCHTIRRMGNLSIPKIEVASGLKPEQVVITPLFDNSCMVSGYEIRYGSEERGCKEAAKRTLSTFYDCTKGQNKQTIKSSTKSPCSYLRKLGLPCD